jgi:hypothetical protein
VRNVIEQLAGELEDLGSEKCHDLFEVGEVARLKQWIEVLEQENRRLSEANDVVK